MQPIGALAEKLGTALQKLPDGSVTRTHLHFNNLCGSDEIGIHETLKMSCPKGVRVRVPPLAPNISVFNSKCYTIFIRINKGKL